MKSSTPMIMIFGFGPYLSYQKNITESVICQIAERKNLHRVVFPVRFDKKIFLEAVEKYRPNIVIGLGQHPRARKIRIERRAVNLKKSVKDDAEKKISPNGPRYQFTNAKLLPGTHARITYNAGTYVCNFSMYILSDCARKNGFLFAFLHIPRKYDIRKAVEFIESKISEMRTKKLVPQK